MTAPPVHHVPAADGLDLAYRTLGEGTPLILLHGLTATGSQWIDHGPAAALAAHGHRVILPDLRGHGESPHPPAQQHYPPDVLADDGLALIARLGLEPGEYALGGYSLGAQVVLRLLLRGARPARAVVGGQGLDAIAVAGGNPVRRRALTALADGEPLTPGSPEAAMAHWISLSGNDPLAMRHVQDSLVATPADALAAIATPVLVIAGDRDNSASARGLAAALPAARFAEVPGEHFGALGAPAFAEAMLAFLGGAAGE